MIPIPWVIFPLTESSHNPPKSLPMSPRDPGFLTNKPDTKWYPLHWRIPLTLSYTHYLSSTKFVIIIANRIPNGQPWHWVIPITLSSTKFVIILANRMPPWVPANRILDEWPWHWVIPITLSSTKFVIILANRIPDGRTHAPLEGQTHKHTPRL